MDFTSTDFLNQVMEEFQTIGRTGMGALQGPALQLCLTLMIIDFVTDWTLYEGNIRLSKIINDIMKGSLFLAIISVWPTIIGTVEQFFYTMGLLAGGESGGNILKPSDIINRGFKICEKLFENFSMSWSRAADKANTAGVRASAQSIDPNAGDLDNEVKFQAVFGTFANESREAMINAFNPVGILCYLIAIIMIIFAHFWIALQLFLTVVEFYIFAALSTIFIPFGVFRHTKFLWDQTVRGVISFGCKMMGTFFLLAVLANSMKFMDANTMIPADKQFSYYLRVGLMYLCLAFLVWKLPDKFAGLLSGGGPSVSGGEAVGGAMMAAGGARRVAGAVTGGVAAVAGAALTVGSLKATAMTNKKNADAGDKNAGPTTFMGVLGNKIGAKVTEPWTGRMANLKRDEGQWKAFKTGNYDKLQGDYHQNS